MTDPVKLTFNKELYQISENDISITAANILGMTPPHCPAFNVSLSEDNLTILIFISDLKYSTDYVITVKSGIFSVEPDSAFAYVDDGSNVLSLPEDAIEVLELRYQEEDETFTTLSSEDYEVTDNEIILGGDYESPSEGDIFEVEYYKKEWELEEDYVIEFSTKIYPLYTTVRSVRSTISSIASELSDSDIEFLIHKHSVYIRDKYNISDPVPVAAMNYVICAVQYDILMNVLFGGGPVTRKRLDNFDVSRGAGYARYIKNLIDMLEKCMVKNADLLAGGSGFNIRTPVKSYRDPRRPKWERLERDAF